MTDLFVPYEQAIKLKELGYDRDCLAYYVVFKSKDGDLVYSLHNSGWTHILFKEGVPSIVNYKIEKHYDKLIQAPLWQQAFDFLLNKLPDYLLNQSEDEFYISKWDDKLEDWMVLKQSNREECLNFLIKEYEKVICTL